MSTVTVSRARVARTISGNAPQVLTLPEAASQTFVKGELVYLSGGYVTECSSDPTAILGIADEDAHNGGSAGLYNVAVVIANSDTIFEVHKTNASGAALATLVTDVGKEFAIYLDSTNSWFTAIPCPLLAHAPRLMCLDHSNFDVVGDTGGRLLVMVLGSYRQLFSTS
jgi:hypothetical protein